MDALPAGRSPGMKLGLAMAIGLLLSIPLFSVWFIVYDRQSQSETARASIAEGWGGPQVIAGPLLVIPYRATVTETVSVGNKPVTQTRELWRELKLAPKSAIVDTRIDPQQRKRSIYEVVVYEARLTGRSQFELPSDLSEHNVAIGDMALERAELRFGLSDPRGIYGLAPRVAVAGRQLALQPGKGTGATGRSGFYAQIDARTLVTAPMTADYAYSFRGNGRLSLVPRAGDTKWTVVSTWPNPSFQGGFLPVSRRVTADGFTASYRVGNLALGQTLLSTEDEPPAGVEVASPAYRSAATPSLDARIELVQPVDLYSRVDRSAKYGFLFIGFTFIAFLLFDVIGGVRVSPVEYLLVGAALVLFFVLLLAFAEVIGFTPAYLVASIAILGLITAYSAAVLKSWKRAAFVGALLAGLYATLYVLLSLEDFALLIGSLALFFALAAVMYLTRNLNWGARPGAAQHVE